MARKNKQPLSSPEFPEIDRMIHEPARLKIMALLYVVEGADFLYVSRQTGLSRGNLSSHMTKLEEVGYIEIRKEFVSRMPHTLLVLTEKGKKAFDNYKETMKGVLDQLP